MASSAEQTPSHGAFPVQTREIRIPSTMEGVRDGIAAVTALFDPALLGEDRCAAIEIALAEIFNNVVEHAYAEQPDHMFRVVVTMEPSELQFAVIDNGHPMPTGRLPSGSPADPNRPDFEQAEGGYGLFLIRQVARKLRYRRVGDENHLTFRISLEKPVYTT